MNKAGFTGISLLIVVTGCLEEPGLPEVREPHCEPRAMREPSRLTLDTSAENHGAIPPCEATVNFAIRGNSRLRTAAGQLKMTGPDGDVLHQGAFATSLEGPNFGTFRNQVRIEPVDGYMCRELTLDLELLQCDDEDGNSIECPEVRVMQSFVLEMFTAHGEDLDVCFDT